MNSMSIHAEDGTCPYPEIYFEIDQAYHECNNGYVKKGASCDLFVEKFKELLPKYDCKRNFDTGPVPAIWLFGAASEDYIELIYELAKGYENKTDHDWFENERKRARDIFLSDEFRAVLDGSLAEEYFPLIEQLKKSALTMPVHPTPKAKSFK